MIELVALSFAFVFAIISFKIVFAASVLAVSSSTSELPSGLSRRSANFDLEQVGEPKRVDESWFNFLWVRCWRAVAAYVRCKRRTMPGRVDLAVVILFLAVATISWLDIAVIILDFLSEHYPRE